MVFITSFFDAIVAASMMMSMEMLRRARAASGEAA